MDAPVNIAVFISGGGTNLQSLINAVKKGKLCGRIALVVSSNADAYGLERAAREGIDTFVYNVKNYSSKKEAHQDLLEILADYDIKYIALAGYLKLLPEPVVQKFRDHITNIHPALLPRYGGKGMYGHRVHQAVLEAGDKESGATVHLVNEIYDEGPIIMQEKVAVKPDDTVESLAARVLEVEHRIYPQALNELIKGEI